MKYMLMLLLMCASLAIAAPGPTAGPEGLPNAGGKVALSTTSAQSAAITGSWIDVTCDVDAFISIAANPTAVADTGYRIANSTTYRLPITSGFKLAGIVSSGTGNCWYHPVR